MSSAPGLANLIRRIESIATTSFRYELARDMSVAALGRVADEFRREANPYDEKWKPRTSGGTWPILDKTGAMKNSAVAIPTADGFRLLFYAVYALFHQLGAFRGARSDIASKKTYRQSGMPSRKLLPVAYRGLPPKWADDFQRCFERRIAASLK